MSVVRQRRQETYTLVPNGSVNHEGLSLRAKGLHAVLLSKPDDWEFSSDRVAAECQEGRDAVRTAMKELRGAGFVRQRKVQGERGRWITVVEVYDIAQPVLTEAPTPENPSSVEESPTPENPTTGNPTTGRPTFGGSGGEVSTQQEALKTKHSGLKNRRAKARLIEDDLQAAGALPTEEAPAPTRRLTRVRAVRASELPTKPAPKRPTGNSARALASYFRQRSDIALGSDPRAECEEGALGRTFAQWRDKRGYDPEVMVTAVDLFFASEAYWRPDQPLWLSFLANRSALLMKARSAPSAAEAADLDAEIAAGLAELLGAS